MENHEVKAENSEEQFENPSDGDGKCVNSAETSSDKAEDRADEIKAEDCTESNDADSNNAESKEEDFIVRIRGLPWSSSKDDIVKFFSDCNIKGGLNGIHMTLSREGRPSGSAYVEFETQEDVDKALEKDNQHIGQRYIEVFRCKKREMRTALRRMGINGEKDSNDACVRLRGLPFECSKEEIAHFFAGLEIVRNGITLPVDFQGRSTGEAYVQFATEDIAEKAMAKHKEKIGHRYIEIFKSSLQEIRNATGMGPMRMRNMGGSDRFHPYDQMDMLGPGGRHGMPRGFGGFGDRFDPHEPLSTGHRVRMRGVPYKATKKDIADFFKPLKPASIRILYESKGRPAGEADVEFYSHKEALKAMTRHREKLQHRYIKLILFSEPKPFRHEMQSYGPENGRSFGPGMDMQLGPMGGQTGYALDVDRRFEGGYGGFPSTDRSFGGYRSYSSAESYLPHRLSDY